MIPVLWAIHREGRRPAAELPTKLNSDGAGGLIV
ncbi:hypothetical protein ACVWWK_003352 [Bradyrhizobium sp. LB9.1b]